MNFYDLCYNNKNTFSQLKYLRKYNSSRVDIGELKELVNFRINSSNSLSNH